MKGAAEATLPSGIGRRNVEEGVTDATSPSDTGRRNFIERLEYPEIPHNPKPGSALSSGSLGRRAAMAQALSEAISEELAGLRGAWGINQVAGRVVCAEGAEEKPSFKEAVYGCLRHIAKRVERACVVKALQLSEDCETLPGYVALPDAGESALEARRAQLEAEIAKTDERIRCLQNMGEEFLQLRQAGFHGHDVAGQQSLVTRLAAPISDTSASTDVNATAFRGQLEQGLQRLALVDLWLSGTLSKLEDVKFQLEQRERAASARAASHLPGAEPDPRRALLKLV